MNKDFVIIAMDVLTPINQSQDKRLNPSLYEYLHGIEIMCRNAGGHLISRQAIAVAIKQWQNEHKAEQPLVD